MRDLWWIGGRYVIRGKPIGDGGVAEWIGRICAGPSGQTQNAMSEQSQISQQQLSLAQQQQNLETQQYNQSQTLEAPLIQYETALASGNRNAAVSAAMPQISTLTQGYNAASQAIKNQLPPGAAQDQALAQLSTQEYTGIASAQANQVLQAPQVLAQLGAGAAGLSVQELAGALSGFSGANTTAGQVAAEGNQAQANKLQLFGGLAGAVGTGVAGFNFGGGGSSASSEFSSGGDTYSNGIPLVGY